MGPSGSEEKETRTSLQRVGLLLGPVLFGVVLTLDLKPGHPEVTRMAAVAVLMATWWITEAIPLAATSLLPLVLYPALGLMSTKAIAPRYMSGTIFLFIGGFLIALAMERWDLHRRIALRILLTLRGGPSVVILGFMLASAFLSMWISNTATAVMMLPIGMAVIGRMEARAGREACGSFSLALMLGIAYACSLGGMATLVGTPPNLMFVTIFDRTFPTGPALSFGQWMQLGLPLAAIMLAITWLLLTKVLHRMPAGLRTDRRVIEEEHARLGPISFEEKVVLLVFVATALLWVFRESLAFGDLEVPGWSVLLEHTDLVQDGTVAIAMALVLFVVPTRSEGAGAATVLDTKVFRRVPWEIVLLFGGGFALAKGFDATGLSRLIGERLEVLAGVPTVLMIACICLLLTFLTELTSNTATTVTILPILAGVAAEGMHVNPLLLMIPATFSASCAFMMPVATPPNAIVFGSGRVRIPQMARTGIFLNLIGVVVITATFLLLGPIVLDIDLSSFPAWAEPGPPGEPSLGPR